MTIKRMRFLQELLALVGLEGRLHLAWISSAEAQKFVRVITDFTEKIRRLGPNPLSKGHALPVRDMASPWVGKKRRAAEGGRYEVAG